MSKLQYIGIYPASFDPITIAHVGIAERAVRSLDKLYVAVAQHPSKNCEFTTEERLAMVQNAIKHIPNAEGILLNDGLTVDHARSLGATIIIRGARDVTDFLDEVDLFRQNIYVQNALGITPKDAAFIDTQTYYALPEHSHISSSLVRTLVTTPNVQHKMDRLQKLVPGSILDEVMSHSQ